MVVLGTFILAFGWFGFNPGSSLAGTDLRISYIVVNTMLASVTGALGAMVALMFFKGLKPDPTMMCNGMLAGLVAITAPVRSSTRGEGLVIGFVAGVLVVYSVFFFEARGVDDPVGAISVHGVNGLWGLLSVGIFATGQYGAGWNGVVRADMVAKYGYDGVRGLLYGDAGQLVMQTIDCVVLTIFAFTMAYVWFKLSNPDHAAPRRQGDRARRLGRPRNGHPRLSRLHDPQQAAGASPGRGSGWPLRARRERLFVHGGLSRLRPSLRRTVQIRGRICLAPQPQREGR